MTRPGQRLLAVYLVWLLGMTLLATGTGFMGTAAAAANAPTCFDVHYSGAGTTDDPYEVGNVEQLQCINEDHGNANSRSDALGASYTLVSDIDASETSSWNGGKGFEPIGEQTFSNRFTGSFYGQSHTISNLTSTRPSERLVGLFGFIGTDAAVSNVSLQNLNVRGDDGTGGLSGTIQNRTTVSNISVSGTVSGGDNVGGIAGLTVAATVSNASTTADVNGVDGVGGLIGDMSNGSVTDAVVAGSVSGTGSDVGSVIGLKGGGSLDNIYRNVETAAQLDALGSGTGSVTGLTTAEMTGINATRNMGDLSFYDTWVPTNGDYPVSTALAGTDGTTADAFDRYFAGTGTESDPYVITTAPELQAMSDRLDAHYALGTDVDASGTEDWNDGTGFVPVGEGGNNVVDFTGSFDGQGHTITGLTVNRTSDYSGLFRWIGSDGSVSNLTLDAVNVTGESYVGSLAGGSYGPTQNVSATGNVTGNHTSGDEIGGLVGYNGGTVTNVSTATNVNGSEDVGGLIGDNYGSVANASASGTVSGQWGVGGLVGYNYWFDITNATTTASVSGNDAVGGLIGYNDNANVTDSLATGNVSGDVNVGGFVGENTYTANLANASARGDVTGNQTVGGFVGENKNSATVRDAFATGSVAGDTDVGGFAGTVTSGSVTDAYWNTDAAGASGNGTVSGGTFDATGLTTAEMTGTNATRTMTGLDFAGLWEPTASYPELGDGYLSTVPGEGTSTDPYRLSSASDLQAIRYDLSANYTLSTDVDASETATWNDGKGFAPLGPDGSAEFVGSFDGNGHVVSSLGIDRSSTDRVGLFGVVGESGTVTNVSVSSVDVDGNDYVGGLAGDVYEGTVRNVSVSGTVNGSSKVGGLAGHLYNSSAMESSSTATVSGDDNIGGLVGAVYDGIMSAVHASGAVHGIGQSGKNVGGLVGQYGSGTIHNASASGDASGPFAVGGLIGKTDGSTSANNVSAVGDVDAGSSGGGLVGSNRGTVRDAFAAGAVTGSTTGGLVGDNAGTVRNSSAAGDVSGNSKVGGLVGDNAGTVEDSFSTGNVSGTDTVGGLVGLNLGGTVADSFSTGAVSGPHYIGGLVGFFDGGTITDAYWRNTTSNPDTAFGDGSVDATGLTTAEMTGPAAAENMVNLTFADPWLTTDGYPVLQNHVTGFSLELGTTSLTEGDTTDATVTLSLSGGRTETATTVATYTTTDTDIADVEAGTLTAAGTGSATITASHAGASDSVGVDVSTPDTDGSDDSGGGGVIGDPLDNQITVEADTTTEGDVTVSTASISASAGATARVQLGVDGESGQDSAGESPSGTAPVAVETLDIEFADDAEGDVSISQSASPPTPDAPEFETDSVEPAGYLRVETDIDNGQIDRAEIGFQMSRSALEATEIDAGSVTLYHYDETAEEWEPLPTEITETNDDVIRFTAVTQEFSDFVIGLGDRGPNDDPDADTPESSRSGTTASHADTGEKATESDQSTKTTETTKTDDRLPADGWLIAMGLAVVGISGAVVIWRWKR